VTVRDEQRERLAKVIDWARRLRAELGSLLEQHGDRVHFRPSSTGVTMVGLLPDRPQRGKRFENVARLAQDFEALFAAHCRDVSHGRVTGEKALQSFLIREAQTNGRRLASLNAASAAADAPVELWFVTDEISLPIAREKLVCDVLALRRDGARCTPVLIELKDRRQLRRLVEQVEGYAQLIDEHADLFEELFGAILGERIRFDGPTEKWLVWPAAGVGPDPRAQELLDRGIRLGAYTLNAEQYSFVVGPGHRESS
jgi:hypothetical protein